MNKSRQPFSLKEAKVQASILLKSLHGNESQLAAKRFQCLADFANLSIEKILQHEIKYKHALAVIAVENDFKTWLDLKIQLHFIVGGYLNLWFSNYAEAKSHLDTSGGFLLPYKNQFFICNESYVKHIGFDPDDPEWKLIAYDWAKPKDKVAWQRLYKKWIKKKETNNE